MRELLEKLVDRVRELQGNTYKKTVLELEFGKCELRVIHEPWKDKEFIEHPVAGMLRTNSSDLLLLVKHRNDMYLICEDGFGESFIIVLPSKY